MYRWSVPTPGPGALTVLSSSGAVVNSLSGAFINGPWGLAISQKGNQATLYVSNLLDGTVWRLKATVSNKIGTTLTSETQISGGYLTAVSFPASANGPAGLAYDSKHDILYVASEVDNEIFSILNASTLTTTTTPGTVVYSDTIIVICTDRPGCCCLPTVTS
jgi:DNA-binding beta-propeller fold protein YncE